MTCTVAVQALLQILHASVGPVTLSDVEAAVAADNAPIFAFNVSVNGGDVTTAAKRSKVDIRKHRVIYSMLDDIQELLVDSIPPILEVPSAHATR